METKDILYTSGLVLLATIMLGTAIVSVFDTGKEITCATNKPNGWNILKDNGDWVEAVCPYTTKAPVYANCSNVFRSTASYVRYGCKEVYVVVDETTPEIPNGEYPEPIPGSVVWKCGKTCERIE